MTLLTLVNVTCVGLFWLVNNVLFYAIKLDGIVLWILPCYDTFHTLQKKTSDANICKRQLCFWMILGIILNIEYITYVLYYYVTIYRILRLIMIIWLSINDYRNSEQLFNSFISYISYQDIKNFINSIKHNYNNIVTYINTLRVTLKTNYFTHSAFKSQNEFAQNIINCNSIDNTTDNTINLCDKFIHINIDYKNVSQVCSAINLATRRAFQSRFVPPITGIIKGKAFGEMLVLSPTGLSNKYHFNGDCVYRGYASFRKSDNTLDTFSCFVYYFQKCFNPIRHANGVDSSNVKFITELGNKTYVLNNNNLYNCFYNDMANKLQSKYLNKMINKNKMNQNDTEQDEKTEQMLMCAPDQVVPPQIPQAPQKNARAFFTDYIVSPHYAKPYVLDGLSDYVGAGSYPNNRVAFPNASNGTFDGIAIDSNTRVILWEKPNFEGNVLLDQIGPAIINNVAYKKLSWGQSAMSDAFADPDLQKNYPPHTRIWSYSNMQTWTSGSVKIVAANTRN